MSGTTFQATRDGVLMIGTGGPVLLDRRQVSQMLNTFEAEARAAEVAADQARRAFNSLFDADCRRADRAQDRAVA
jgi:hypothetical protein